MEKQIKYRIFLQHEDTGVIITKDFNYAEIFSGVAFQFIKIHLTRYFVIGKSEFTGRIDCKGCEIYENDIIEFDAKEWGDEFSNIHLVTWDNINSSWSFGGGCASDMNWRTVIGNKFNNPDLWGKYFKK